MSSMGFLSFKFILFLSITFTIYFLIPKKYQWIVLLVCSYLYYYLNSQYLTIVLFVESIITFAIGSMINSFNKTLNIASISKQKKTEITNKKKAVLIIGIVSILLILIVFKYTNFLIQNANSICGTSFSFLEIVLPLGISFYSLQAISYIVDVSKNKIETDDNILHFFLYMSYFPQIIQGPIPRYHKLANQLFEQHDYDYDRITKGLQLMFWGIAKKVIIADRIAKPVAYFFDNYIEFSGLSILLGGICYGFQVYADFSGGIDAIRGISEVFGIYLEDNFEQPFFAKSVEEFWRRWHISLGSWMKDYVFYPLSLSKLFNKIGRKSRSILGDRIGKKIAPCLAMFIVYFLVGLWHGADWKYVVYGVWNGVFIMGNILFNEYKKLHNYFKINYQSNWWLRFSMLRTFIITSVGRLISRSNNIYSAIYLFKSMFIKPFDFSFVTSDLLQNLGLDTRNWILLIISIIVVLFVDYLKEESISIRDFIANQNVLVRWAVYLFLIISIVVFGLYGGEYDASSFIYGRF